MMSESMVYKTVGAHELAIDVFRPAGDAGGARPGIVFFHAGGWRQGSPGQFHPHCRYLASRGMVAMSAEYRVEQKHRTGPRECVMDGKSAMLLGV